MVLLSIAGGLLVVGSQAYGLGPRFLPPSLVDSAAYAVLAVLALATVIQLVIWWRRLPPTPVPTTAPVNEPIRDPMVNIRLLVRYLEPIRAWLPLMAAVFALLYAIGFLVVSSYLGQYGVRELEPVRARYAAAAPVFALFVGAVVSFVGGLGRGRLKLEWQPPGGRPQRVARTLFWLAAAFIALVLAQDEFLARFGSGSDDIWKKYRDLALVNFSIAMPYWIARGTTRWDWQQVFSVVGFGLVALTSYATNVYVRVPAWAGGGHPDPVQIAFVGDAPTECLPCRERVDLIDADDFRVIVLVTRDGRADAVELARNTVRAIIHLPSK